MLDPYRITKCMATKTQTVDAMNLAAGSLANSDSAGSLKNASSIGYLKHKRMVSLVLTLFLNQKGGQLDVTH